MHNFYVGCIVIHVDGKLVTVACTTFVCTVPRVSGFIGLVTKKRGLSGLVKKTELNAPAKKRGLNAGGGACPSQKY